MSQPNIDLKAGEIPQYTRQDFMSDQEIRWCPGCGDYSILTAMQKALPEMGKRKEDFVFISGIGCSSRFPYYMDTYGFHTIHGRAPAIASGVKIMNPDLSVWVITGDGDGLSIGGNHLIHALRRNVGLKIVLFNNAIYGLTKGQASPTSVAGTVTKSTPYGSVDNPFAPLPLAMVSGATFVARSADILVKHMTEVFVQAEKHQGVAFMEVLQNCHIFNDGVFKNVTDKKIRSEKLLLLEHGKPMVFGEQEDKALIIDGKSGHLKVVQKNEVADSEILVHDAHSLDATIHLKLASLRYPYVMGTIRSVETLAYETAVLQQEQQIIEKKGLGKLSDLLNEGETWQVR